MLGTESESWHIRSSIYSFLKTENDFDMKIDEGTMNGCELECYRLSLLMLSEIIFVL